jgi:hypothetical protein
MWLQATKYNLVDHGSVQGGNCIILCDSVPSVIWFLWQSRVQQFLLHILNQGQDFQKSKNTFQLKADSVISVHCARKYSEILSKNAICTLTIHSILYSDFLNVYIYIHIYNRALTCIKTNKKCLYFLVTVLQLSIWHSSTMIIMTNWKLGSCIWSPQQITHSVSMPFTHHINC